MTNQSSLSKGMNCLRCLVLFLTVAVMMTAPCHAESDMPQEEESPAMIDPSHPDYITEIQPLSVESPPPPPPSVQPLEVAAAVESPAPIEEPAQSVETPVPVEPQAEIPMEPQAEAPVEVPVEVPSESPATVEPPAPEAAPAAGDALPEDVPQTQETPQ